MLPLLVHAPRKIGWRACAGVALRVPLRPIYNLTTRVPAPPAAQSYNAAIAFFGLYACWVRNNRALWGCAAQLVMPCLMSLVECGGRAGTRSSVIK